jgi:hypothetical protein
LAYVTAAMALCAPSYFFTEGVHFGSAAFWGTAVLTLFSYFALWHFWKGANWARWLVMVDSFIGILNLFLLPNVSRPMAVMIVLEAALSAYLLVWLNRGSGKAYFVPTPDA